MEDNFLSIKECTDLSINSSDPETIEIINNAKIAYYGALKVFPELKKDEFLSAFLAGYYLGVLKGISAFKELNIR
jgi:hypothetical protein